MTARSCLKVISRFRDFQIIKKGLDLAADALEAPPSDLEFHDGRYLVKGTDRGITLAESQVRKKYGITVVGVKSPGKEFTYATADTVISNHDLIIASGNTSDLDRFAALG